jgi:ferredoxin--NADP+ reductase
MYEILDKKSYSRQTIISMRIDAPEISRKGLPGQFVIIITDKTGERIPLTIADNDPVAGTITLVFQIVGKSTALLGSKNVGDYIKDVIGPLGKAVEMKKYDKKILVIGGGTGIAVLHHIAKGYYEQGNKLISIIGARTKEFLIMKDEMKKISDEFHITTDDGTEGFHGFVTQVSDMILSERGDEIEFAVAIGPVVMMKACCDITKKYNKETIVSLNPIMIDGTGMCGSCRVEVNNETKFACVHGPQFDGHKVNFDLLMERQKIYLEDERISLYKSIK